MGRTGRPLTKPEKRFMEKVRIIDGCWVWIGAITWDGYGRFRLPDKTVKAHRWSYQHFVGRLPDGLTVDHLCGTRSCVNPNHLEPVTMVENLNRGDGYGRKRTTPYVRPKKINRNLKWYSG